MGIREATERYEAWLGSELVLVPADIRSKHDAMAKDAFRFLRATFYRWMERWNEEAGELREAPSVLSVGDLHIGNFGTWRDVDGRLVWGVNDFDEAFPLPWTQDLVRLATSAELAIRTGRLTIARRDACVAILDGYALALRHGGRPFVLVEGHQWLRKVALDRPRNPQGFWKKLERSEATGAPPEVLRALRDLLPEHDLECRIVHRVAGLGSLGRQRFALVADWRGGKVAREAKPLVPSACAWALSSTPPGDIHYQALLDSAVRDLDPVVRLTGGWVVRRLAPDCARIELADLPKGRGEARLLHSMGYETGNIHLGSAGARADVLKDLESRRSGWLERATRKMTKIVREDWKDWVALALR